MSFYRTKIFFKRNLKLFLIKIFYLFKLDLIYLKKKDRFEIVLENSKFFKKSSDEEIINALHKTVPIGCNKELVRIGGKTDGAYLIPRDLDDIDACFSPGTSSYKNFEDDLAQNYNIKSFLADASVEKSELDLITNLQFFQKKWIGDFDSKDTLSMKSWIDQSGYGEAKNLLLQMDIEGCEYQSILSMPEKYLKKFKIVIIEFHDLERLEKTRFLNQIFEPVMSKILNNFDCVHIHGNNNCGTVNLATINIPKVIELTFYRKSCNKGKKKKLLPHPLDISNVEHLPPIILDNFWIT